MSDLRKTTNTAQDYRGSGPAFNQAPDYSAMSLGQSDTPPQPAPQSSPQAKSSTSKPKSQSSSEPFLSNEVMAIGGAGVGGILLGFVLEEKISDPLLYFLLGSGGAAAMCYLKS